jgi:hypothetical protein
VLVSTFSLVTSDMIAVVCGTCLGVYIEDKEVPVGVVVKLFEEEKACVCNCSKKQERSK